MDIKNVAKSLLVPQVQVKSKIEKTLKTDTATDRDANGQMPNDGSSEQDHEPLNEEQFKKCLDHLKNLDFVKNNNLCLQVESINNKRFVILKELSGKILRRISEAELKTLKSAQDQSKGKILRKIA